jgi:hypothetical protein
VTGDTYRKQQVTVTYILEYQEEEEYPIPYISSPALFPREPVISNSTESGSRTDRKSDSKNQSSDRALWYLGFISTACLGALVLAPVPIVQAAAAAIWLGSLKLAQRMLKSN